MTLQNAMNAAEITDKLGLHSLRQRAWVIVTIFAPVPIILTVFSTFNRLVLHRVTVYMKA